MSWILFIVFGILIISLILIMAFSQQPTCVQNGSLFPKKKVMITNNSTTNLTDLWLVDSLGNSCTIADGFVLQPKKSIIISPPSIPNYGSIQFSAMKGEDDVKMILLNNNGKAMLIPLLNTDNTIISFYETRKAITHELEMVYDSNTTYSVKGVLIQTGDPFPNRFVFDNNTVDGTVLTNSDNDTGTNPDLDKLLLTSFYVMDSEDNTYADINLPESILFTPDNKSTKSNLSIGARPILIELDKPINPNQNIQIYIEDQTTNYTIVMLNLNNKVVLIYPPDIDPTAVTLRSVSSDTRISYSIKEPCRTLNTTPKYTHHEKYTAVFNTTTIWRAEQMDPPISSTAIGTLKVGFMGGKPWQWAWIAKIITESGSISNYAAIDFNFVFPYDPISYTENPNPPAMTVTRPVDASYHIRVSFDPAGGAYSSLGNQSIQNNDMPLFASMNLGWMDAPLDTQFNYDNITYKTDVTFDQGGYPGFGTIIVHEFCHALGMDHEHQNPRSTDPTKETGVPWNFNKPLLKKYFGGPPNNWTADDVNVQIIKALSKEITKGSTFDNASIMRYAFPLELLVDASNYPCVDKSPLVLSSCDKHWLHTIYPGRNITTECVPGPNAFCPTPENPNPTPVPSPPPIPSNDNYEPIHVPTKENDPVQPQDPIIISNQPTMDCAVSSWSEWSNCSAQCGTGSQVRTRSIVTKPTNDGALCPVLIETQDCNTNVCPYTIIPWQTIARRKQWDGNFGYCGETSYIAAAMHYGMYMSQYDLRRYTSLTQTQTKETDQVLIGEESEIAAADLFKLNYEQWRKSSTYCRQSNTCDHTLAFCNWAQSHLNKGRPVISVVYNKTGKNPLYDHIISLFQATTTGNSPQFIFWDNYAEPLANPPTGLATNPYTYNYPSIKRTRAEAIAASDEYSLPSGKNFGTAITGINSSETSLVRIQLVGNPNREEPEIVDKSATRPASVQLTLTLHLYNLQPNVTYNLYRYTDPLILPTEKFNQAYTEAVAKGVTSIIKEVIPATANPSPDTVMTKTMRTSDVAIYRCVPDTAL